jgi:hypothetical protein
MTYRAFYAYAWDLVERGIPEVVAEVRDLGLNTLSVAGAYHAGKFLRPRGTGGKTYFPEDGTVYFRPDPSRYGKIKPIPNAILEERDVFAELTKDGGVAVNAWMVLLHNTRIGMAHPEATVETAFGDRLVYSLCPANPDARDFAIGLCRDVAERYPVMGMSIETPGFLPSIHGYHHEFNLVKPNRWLDGHLGLCFCEHCRAGAKAAGIDADGLRARVRADVESYLAADIDLPEDMGEAIWLADTRTDGELAAFLSWRCDVVTSLVADIRAAVRKDAAVAIIPSVARPTGGAWYEGTDLKALAAAAGIIEACFYEPSAARVLADAWDVKRRIGDAGAIRGIMRAAHPDLNSAGEVAAAVAGLRAAGIEDVAFYNFGFYRPRSFEWIRAAFQGT